MISHGAQICSVSHTSSRKETFAAESSIKSRTLRWLRRHVVAFLLTSALLAFDRRIDGSEPKSPANCLVVVLDGLRPEYITLELMPHLHALGQHGAVALEHHAVFPTVTRVNAASLATGTYPAVHGVLYNEIYLPEILPDTNIDTAKATLLMQAEERSNGQLVTALSLGELLEASGKRVFVATSSSTGAAFLLNHKLLGDGVWNSDQFVMPASRQKEALEHVGPFPDDSAASHWAVDACAYSLSREHPSAVTFLWLGDTDSAGHKYGVGASETLAAVRKIDAEVGRLLERLEECGRRGKINIFVTADHGFSNHTGQFEITKLLAQHQLDADVRVVGGRLLYVRNHDETTIRRIVELLQRTEWVGAIFTPAAQPGSPEGVMPGTLSFDSISWNHPRAADILVDANWEDTRNAHGYPGSTTNTGVAGHGSSSPFDIHIRLVADGPDIGDGVISSIPTGNIDLAPTICSVLGINRPDTMRGRVLKELLRDGPAPRSVPVRAESHRVSSNGYQLELETSQVGQTTYIDSTRITRAETGQP